MSVDSAISSESRVNSLEKSPDEPSITLILWAYNQEQYITEAMRSVFAQRCPPIDIVISDDCSSDGTFAVIEREAAAYRGPHRVRVIRNDRNLGVMEHFSRRMLEAKTDWVLCAAGDDISHPERVARLISAIQRVPDLVAFGSLMDSIDESGRVVAKARRLSVRLRSLVPSVLRWASVRRAAAKASREDRLMAFVIEEVGFLQGASAAWRRTLVADFPPIRPDAPEDYVLSFRAAAAGTVVESTEALVRYRRHSSNAWSAVTAGMDDDQRSRLWTRQISFARAMYSQNLADLAEFEKRGAVDAEFAHRLATAISVKNALFEFVKLGDWWNSGFIAALLVGEGLARGVSAPDGRLTNCLGGRTVRLILRKVIMTIIRWDRGYRLGAKRAP